MPNGLDHQTVRDELMSLAKRPYAVWDCEAMRRAALDAVALLDHYASYGKAAQPHYPADFDD